MDSENQQSSEQTDPSAAPSEASQMADEPATPSRRIRALSSEAQQRGASVVSAEAMQSRLFDIYDDVGAVSEASRLVQHQLRLTLERTWYSSDEIDQLADQIDRFLAEAPEGSISTV